MVIGPPAGTATCSVAIDFFVCCAAASLCVRNTLLNDSICIIAFNESVGRSTPFVLYLPSLSNKATMASALFDSDWSPRKYWFACLCPCCRQVRGGRGVGRGGGRWSSGAGPHLPAPRSRPVAEPIICSGRAWTERHGPCRMGHAAWAKSPGPLGPMRRSLAGCFVPWRKVDGARLFNHDKTNRPWRARQLGLLAWPW